MCVCVYKYILVYEIIRIQTELWSSYVVISLRSFIKLSWT